MERRKKTKAKIKHPEKKNKSAEEEGSLKKKR